MRQFIVEGEPGIFPPTILRLLQRIGIGRGKRAPGRAAALDDTAGGRKAEDDPTET